jgi:hypothetical protein
MANWSDELKIKKEWGVGDLLENQTLPISEKINYSHVEALSGNDIDNHISIRRGMRNIMDNQNRLADYLSAFVKEMAPFPESSYIFSGILNEFEVVPPDEYDEYNNETDFIVVEYKEEKKVYVRVRSGVGGIGQEPQPDGSFEVTPVVLKPQIFSTERELIKVLELRDWHPITENAFIYYDRETDSYHAKIDVRIGEEIEEKFFTNGGVFQLFETGGYKSGIELLKAISEDSDLSNTFFKNVNSLDAFSLEPVFEIPTNEIVTRHIGFDLSGELKMVENEEEIRLIICSFTIDATDPDDIQVLDFEDKRNFLRDVQYKYNVTIQGTLIVQGDQVIEGQTSIAANEIVLNSDFDLDVLPSTNLSGVRVNRGTTETDYLFVFRQSDETFVIGEEGDLQAVATRQNNPVSNAIPFWNNTQKRFDTSADFTWFNNNISLNGSINNLTLATDSARTLTINNADKTLAGAGTTLTFGGNFTHSGAHTLTITTTANTNLTLPTSGTLISSINTSTTAEANTVMLRDANGRSQTRIPISQPSSLSNGDIWVV